MDDNHDYMANDVEPDRADDGGYATDDNDNNSYNNDDDDDYYAPDTPTVTGADKNNAVMDPSRNSGVYQLPTATAEDEVTPKISGVGVEEKDTNNGVYHLLNPPEISRV